jgi:hypothetical protein
MDICYDVISNSDYVEWNCGLSNGIMLSGESERDRSWPTFIYICGLKGLSKITINLN